MELTEFKDNSEKEFDVIIVGGGPAGISTWLHLHKYAPELASKTILIEKEKYPREKVCGGALLDWGQNIIKNLGIKMNIPSVSISNTVYRYGDEEYCHKIKDFLKIVNRLEFDHFLAKEASSKSRVCLPARRFLEKQGCFSTEYLFLNPKDRLCRFS